VTPPDGPRRLRAAFVNVSHPRVPHVSGMRVPYFARQMSQRGHKIVLLTPSLGGGDKTTRLPLSNSFSRHDWREPLHVSCEPLAAYLDDGFRDGWRGLRTAKIAAGLLFGDGLQPSWPASARPYLRELSDAFLPDVVWATFGSVSNLIVARELADISGAAWVMDIKDNWRSYVPWPIGGAVARRFRSVAGFTANSEHHAEIARRWFDHDSVVIYSGVAQEMIADKGQVDFDTFRIMLMGSIYENQSLIHFLDALRRWLGRIDPPALSKIEFRYAGSAFDRVQDATRQNPLPCRVIATPTLPLDQLARQCHGAAVNCYLWFPTTFHHKLLELLACGRPVIAFPGEHEESIALARRLGGELHPCSDASELSNALDCAWTDWRGGVENTHGKVDAGALSWSAMTDDLEAFLLEAVASRHGRVSR